MPLATDETKDPRPRAGQAMMEEPAAPASEMWRYRASAAGRSRDGSHTVTRPNIGGKARATANCSKTERPAADLIGSVLRFG